MVLFRHVSRRERWRRSLPAIARALALVCIGLAAALVLFSAD
jgi:hypothetical protein